MPSGRWTALTERPLDLGAVHASLADERAGGTWVSVGASRRWTDGAETDLLTHEAHAGMAEAELDRLAATARERWDAEKVVVLHRVGILPSPQPSVVVGVAVPAEARRSRRPAGLSTR